MGHTIFSDYGIQFAGRKYTIPATRMLGAVAAVEDVITYHELMAFGRRGTMPMARLAQAYGAVLRYAGADLDDETVYEAMFRDSAGQGPDAIAAGILGLLEIILPNSVKATMTGAGGATPGNSRKTRRAAAAQSRKSDAAPTSRSSTRRQSAGSAGSPPPSSGG